ncbi:hypothetical protein [Cognatilysobacter segetis]|uniref:hypothetical protein n=1 Tax=Cognatilysobacter segetis TaxID=2492394 RepID=UPI00105B861E|nr:hypothetical protein [Lysobacter segetis]
MAHPTARLLAVALLASTALVACKKHDETPPATAPAPASTGTDTGLPPAAPAPMPSTPAPAAGDVISDVQLGTSVGADNRVASPMTSFGTKDTLYASVTTAANATGKLGARWTYLGADGMATPTEVDTQTKDLAGAAATHEFHVSKPDGWPAGKYRVEITHDGTVVQTRDFDVR